MNARVVLSVISLWFGCVLVDGEVVNLETRGRSYRANFTFKIHDVLTVPYTSLSSSFRSQTFATSTDKDVKWYFKVNLHPKIEVDLYLSSLPYDVALISGALESGFIDVNGNKKYKHQLDSSRAVGGWFAGLRDTNRSELENNPAYVPNGHLTVFFDIDAILVYNLNVTYGILPIVVIQRTATDGSNPLQCRKQLARDTFHLINLHNGTLGSDIELKSSNKTVKCHSVILTSRLPLLKLNDADPTHYDFSDELNPEELEDLVSFIYWGKMNNWRRSCLALYGVASKYGVKCLRETCVDAMVGQVKDLNE